MTSLKTRLLAGLLGALTFIGVIAGFAAYVLDRNEVDESLDGQLRQIALSVGEAPHPVAAREGDKVAIDPEDEFVITIWSGSGSPQSSDPAYRLSRPSAAGYSEFRAAGEDWRAFTHIAGDRIVQVAQRLVVRAEFAANSAIRAVLPIAALIPLSWLLVSWMVSRVLRPLGSITEELRGWGKAGNTQLSLDGLPDEVLPLALTTNDLVTRLQSQIEFRERFISDAAHELRTPLTALRLQARNLSGTAESSEQAALVAELSAGIGRMSEMVTKLLELARADTSIPVRAPQPVNLGEAIAASLQDVMPLATEKAIDIGMVSSCDEEVQADPQELRSLVANLVENAVRYTGAGGVVDLSVERIDSEVVLEVRDTGPGIPEEVLGRVFDRFFRAAGPDSTGSGLGLPIVKAIASRWGARVSLLNRQDRKGLVARVVFGAVAEAPAR